MVAVRHVRLFDASAVAGRVVLAIGVAAGDLHADVFRRSVGRSAQHSEAGFGGGKSGSSGAIHAAAAACFLIAWRLL